MCGVEVVSGGVPDVNVASIRHLGDIVGVPMFGTRTAPTLGAVRDFEEFRPRVVPVEIQHVVKREESTAHGVCERLFLFGVVVAERRWLVVATRTVPRRAEAEFTAAAAAHSIWPAVTGPVLRPLGVVERRRTNGIRLVFRRDLGTEAQRLRNGDLRLVETVRMVERVRYLARRVLREVPADAGRDWRDVRYDDVLVAAAIPRRRHAGKLLAVDERDELRPCVEVVDAGRRRLRVRERKPAVNPQRGRHLADEEVVRLLGHVESVGLVEPHLLTYAPPDGEQQNVRGRTAPHLGRGDERHDGIADDETSRAGAGHHDLKYCRVVVRLRVGERAVRGAGVEDVFKDGVRRSFGI